MDCFSYLICASVIKAFVGFRENQVSLVLLGIVATQELQVYLVSRVYQGLLGRKVERCELIYLNTLIIISRDAISASF